MTKEIRKILNKYKIAFSIGVVIYLAIPFILNFVIFENSYHSNVSNDGWANFIVGYIGILASAGATLLGMYTVYWQVTRNEKKQETDKKLGFLRILKYSLEKNIKEKNLYYHSLIFLDYNQNILKTDRLKQIIYCVPEKTIESEYKTIFELGSNFSNTFLELREKIKKYNETYYFLVTNRKRMLSILEQIKSDYLNITATIEKAYQKCENDIIAYKKGKISENDLTKTIKELFTYYSKKGVTTYPDTCDSFIKNYTQNIKNYPVDVNDKHSIRKCKRYFQRSIAKYMLTSNDDIAFFIKDKFKVMKDIQIIASQFSNFQLQEIFKRSGKIFFVEEITELLKEVQNKNIGLIYQTDIKRTSLSEEELNFFLQFIIYENSIITYDKNIFAILTSIEEVLKDVNDEIKKLESM